MVDLSNLKLVEENIEVADDSQYVDASEFPPPIPEGIYTFVQGKPEFGATGAGFLQATMTHAVAGGEQDGAKISFDRVSNKPFERSGVRVNMMKDHLRALGDHTAYRSHAEYAAALEAGEGKAFKAQVQWEAGCNHADTEYEVGWNDRKMVTDPATGQSRNIEVFRVRGSRNFPTNGSGKPSETVKCSICGQDVAARARISRRIAQ